MCWSREVSFIYLKGELVMNNERMPINIYKLDDGYNDKGMNSKELIKDYKQNIQKWCFIAVADIVFAVITVFINFKAWLFILLHWHY